MMFFTHVFALVCFFYRLLQPGQCFREKTEFYKYEQKYLANYVIDSVKEINDESECAMQCVRHGSCASVNYQVSGVSKGLCELNSKKLYDELVTEPQFNHLYIIQRVRNLSLVLFNCKV